MVCLFRVFCDVIYLERRLKIVGYRLNSNDCTNSADLGFILPSVSRKSSNPDRPTLKYLDSGSKTIAANKLIKNTMSATNSVPDNLL